VRPVPPEETRLRLDQATGEPTSSDCRTCELRERCISYGWRSPGGLWFEHAVVLRPKPGCRGFIGRGDDIRDHFGTREKPYAGH